MPPPLLAGALARAAASAALASAQAATAPAASTLLLPLLRRGAAASASASAPPPPARGAPQPPPVVPHYPPPATPDNKPLHAIVNGRRITLHPPSSSAPNSSTTTNWPPTLLDAASAAGASVPTLCKPPKIPSRNPGTCRVCMVEVDGVLKPACCTPLPRDGAVIDTDTERVVASVRGTLALLRRAHPEACSTCFADGRCEFQDLIARYDVPLLLPKAPHLSSRAANAGGRSDRQKDHRAAVAPLGPKGGPQPGTGPVAAIAHDAWLPYDASSTAIAFDADKCIQCMRCTDVCADQGMDVLAFYGRGQDRHLGFAASDAAHSRCVSCGQCVSTCPVGALSEKTDWREVLGLLQQRQQARPRQRPTTAQREAPSSSAAAKAGSPRRAFASQAQTETRDNNPAHPKRKRPVLVAQTAPSVRVALAEEVGLAPGSVTAGQLVAALRALGFDYVFDTDFSADLTIVEEGNELLQRLARAWADEALGPEEDDAAAAAAAPPSSSSAHAPAPALPMFTSCCPAWVHLVEDDYPSLIPNLSSCKSPQGMLAAVIKQVWWPRERERRLRQRRAAAANSDDDDDSGPEEECVHVSVMPCVAKKAEAARPQLKGDVDYVLTTRELGRMLRLQRVPVASLPREAPESRYDDPLGLGTGAGVLFGTAGGVMEAALRTVYELATGQVLGRLVFEPVQAGFAMAPARSPYNATTASGHTQGGGTLGEAAIELPVAPILRLGLGEAGKERAERAIAKLGGEEAKRTVRVCVASGVAAARRLLDADVVAARADGNADGNAQNAPNPAPPSSLSSPFSSPSSFPSPLHRYHFVEVMACPGGCVNGGGQPKAAPARPGHPETAWPAVVAARAEAIRALDRAAPLRRSHLNPDVRALYGLDDGDEGDDKGDDDGANDDDASLPRPRLRGGIGGHDAHALLHTTYRAFEGASETGFSPPYASERRAKE
jgi:NADH-quinone oxidoreductase subunit G